MPRQLPASVDAPPDSVTLWVVYRRPLDHPNDYVLRPQFAIRDGSVRISTQVWHSPTLDGIRAALPPGVTPLGRQPHDDPTIVEVWI